MLSPVFFYYKINYTDNISHSTIKNEFELISSKESYNINKRKNIDKININLPLISLGF